MASPTPEVFSEAPGVSLISSGVSSPVVFKTPSMPKLTWAALLDAAADVEVDVTTTVEEQEQTRKQCVPLRSFLESMEARSRVDAPAAEFRYMKQQLLQHVFPEVYDALPGYMKDWKCNREIKYVMMWTIDKTLLSPLTAYGSEQLAVSRACIATRTIHCSFNFVAENEYECCHLNINPVCMSIESTILQVQVRFVRPVVAPALTTTASLTDCEVDILKPDLGKFPRLASIPDSAWVELVLTPGHALLIPGHWYHHVVTEEDSVSINAFGFGPADVYFWELLRGFEEWSHGRGWIYVNNCVCHAAGEEPRGWLRYPEWCSVDDMQQAWLKVKHNPGKALGVGLAAAAGLVALVWYRRRFS